LLIIADSVAASRLFADASIDLVFTAGVLIHVPPEQLERAQREVHRVSRKYILAVEYFSARPEAVEYRGHAGMRRYWESFQDVMEEIRFVPERLWEAGETVVAATHITAKGRQTAIPVEQRFAGVWTICDRKAIRVRVYPSLSEALETVGLTE